METYLFSYLDPETMAPGDHVISRSGFLFEILGFTRYGLNCSVTMVRYTNITPTKDYPAGTEWSLELDIFLKTFRRGGG